MKYYVQSVAGELEYLIEGNEHLLLYPQLFYSILAKEKASVEHAQQFFEGNLASFITGDHILE